MNWIRDLFRRHHRHTPPPPPVEPEWLDRARKEAAHADEALRWVEAQDQHVDERSARTDRIRRENSLGPAFMRVLREGRD